MVIESEHAGEEPPSPKWDHIFINKLMIFYIKKQWSECGAAAPQHWEGASQSEEGASSLLGVGGSPLLTGSHLQLGGTLVP